jgi:hypothetical protein
MLVEPSMKNANNDDRAKDFNRGEYVFKPSPIGGLHL